MHIGGAKRMVCPESPPLPSSKPSSRAVSSYPRRIPALAGSLVVRSFTISMASMRHLPRTSPMMECFSLSFSSPARM